MQRAPFCAACCKPYALQGSGKPVGDHIPKLLDCSHTFCRGCVIKLSANQTRGFNCPTCGKTTVLPGGPKSVKSLPTNLYILGILMENLRANIERDVPKSEIAEIEVETFGCGTGTEPFADVDEATAGPSEECGKVCDECRNSLAVSQCEKCEALFCEECFDLVHSSSRTLRTHKAIPLADGTSTADEASPTGNKHEVGSVDEMTDDIKEKVRQCLKNVKDIQMQLRKSKERLALFVPMIKVEFDDVKQKIESHFQDLHTKLQAREINLVREVKQAYCKSSFPTEIADEIDQKSSQISRLIAQANAVLSAQTIPGSLSKTLLSSMAVFEDIPCVLLESSIQDLVQVSYCKEIEESLNLYGTVVIETSNVNLKKISDAPKALEGVEEAAVQRTHSQVGDAQWQSNLQNHTGPVKTPSHQNLVVVSHILTPTDFYVHYVGNNGKLEDLMDDIHAYCKRKGGRKQASLVRTVKPGELVLASVDDWWYRARVVDEQSCSSKQGLPRVKIFTIDYGSTHVVPLNRLQKILPKFVSPTELAINCALVDVVPPGQCESWPHSSIKAFGSMIRDKNLLMAVVSKSSGKLVVDLKSPDTDGGTCGQSPASVRDALVFLEVAKFASPASLPHPNVVFPVFTYPKVVMPRGGETLQVTVTYAQSPDALYVQPYNSKEYENMLKILQQMSNVYSSKGGDQWQVGWPYKDMVCAARYSEDGNWYRALVTDVTQDKIARVLFVDFGNSERRPFTEIRRLPDHLAKLPRQAMRCSLAGIAPVDKATGWSGECCEFLNATCFLHPYEMRVVDEEDGDKPMSVLLRVPHPKDATTTSLNRELVEHRFAIQLFDAASPVEPCSPASTSSPGYESPSSAQGRLIYPESMCYKPVEMPVGNKFELVVTHVNSDCTVCGLLPAKYDHSLPNLMRHMQKICSEDGASLTQDRLSFNQPCCARYSDDNEWYRAQIVAFPTATTVLVDYVDFGNQEEVPLTNISLERAFLEIPKQCVTAKLDATPRSRVEEERVSRVLKGLLVGQICHVESSRRPTAANEVLHVEHLYLANGEDALEVATMTLEEEEPVNERNGVRQELGSPKVEGTEAGHSKRTSQQQGHTSIISESTLPLEGVPFYVMVTEVNSKNVVYLQREIAPADASDTTQFVANEHLKQLLEMSEKINEADYFEGKPGVKKAWKNMLCCARYTEDNFWYRAQVQEVTCHDPLLARVLYFDYGTSEVIGADRMKAFSADLASLPKQAFRCRISGLGDDPESDGDEYDREDDIDALSDVVSGKKLVCHVVSFGPPILVELYDRVFGDDDSFRDVLISQRLAEIADCDDDAGGAKGDEGDCDGADTASQDGFVGEEKLEEERSDDEDDPDEVLEDFLEDVKHVQECVRKAEVAHRPQLLTPAQFLVKNGGLAANTRNVKDEKDPID